MRRRLLVLMLVAVFGVLTASADPTPTPSPPPSPTPICESAPRTRLMVRDRGRVSTEDPRPLNVRDRAGTDARLLGQIDAGEIFYVLAGPECAQAYAWYRVEYKGIVGWIAEGDATSYYVEPYPPGW